MQKFENMDVIAALEAIMHQNGQDTAHYCDSVGFQQVPEFLREIRCAPQNFPRNKTKI